MKKFLIPILVAGVLSSFATTTNVVYIDVNNLQDFEIQMSPETGETNVINFKVYQDRSALDLSGLTPVLYAARDEAISRNVITIEGSSSGNVATITTAGVNLSQGMSELYLRLDFRSGKNPSKYTYPYRVKGKMLILENPITQTGDPVLIGELYFASASITNDFAAATLTNNISALEAGTNTWNAAIQPEDSMLAGATSVGAYDSISIGFSADAVNGGTSLGSKTDSGMSSVAVGLQAVASERYGVSIGYDSSALEEGIAIGKNSHATTNAIQLGEGNNTIPGTLQIYDSPLFDFVSGELYPDVFDPFANALGSAAWSNSTDFVADAELLATSNTLAAATSAVAESVVNLSYVVNPSLWGLSINGDMEPAGVSFGLLDDGLFEIDLTTGDIVLSGTQSTRFWQVSGSDIYPEVN